jgi:hypothetical protein
MSGDADGVDERPELRVAAVVVEGLVRRGVWAGGDSVWRRCKTGPRISAGRQLSVKHEPSPVTGRIRLPQAAEKSRMLLAEPVFDQMQTV